jgi:hypothetical protein
MTDLLALWLPIVLSAVAVFVASSIIHMALMFWHQTDYPKIPNEDAVMDALRPLATPPGDYMVPRCQNMKEMGTPEFQDKLKKGPVMILTVMPNGMFDMRRSLSLWFLYCLAISILTGYAAGIVFPAKADHSMVFRLTSVVAFMGYAAALWQMTVWYRRAVITTFKATVDGLIYALVTAALFAWLWP